VFTATFDGQVKLLQIFSSRTGNVLGELIKLISKGVKNGHKKAPPD